jgi:hypothetical protein
VDNQTAQALETLVEFGNELSQDLGELKSSMGGLKAYIAQEIATGIEAARAELSITMYSLVAEANQNAQERAAAAQKELADISELMASGGQMKTVRLIHDAEGKTVGAIVTERTN